MNDAFSDLLQPEVLDPRNTPVSIPMTKAEHDRYREIGNLMKQVTKRHVVPNCARKAVLRALDELEAWAKEKLAEA